MIWLVFERESGVVVGSINRDTRPTVMDHHDTLEYEGESAPDFNTVRVEDGALVHFVSPEHLASLKLVAGNRIKAARDAAVAKGAVTPWGVFQADQQSSTNINGAVSMAILGGEDFSINWRTADNKSVLLDAKGMIGVGVMVGQFVSAIYERSWALQEAVQAAETPEAIRAIDIEGASWVA